VRLGRERRKEGSGENTQLTKKKRMNALQRDFTKRLYFERSRSPINPLKITNVLDGDGRDPKRTERRRGGEGKGVTFCSSLRRKLSRDSPFVISHFFVRSSSPPFPRRD
jgi:hypothetical protein